MPNYEYLCDHCQYQFDLFQGMSDKPVRKCPKCAKKVTRLMGSGSGIMFKGSGFYETDYKRPPAKESKPEADKPKSIKPDSKETTKKKPVQSDKK